MKKYTVVISDTPAVNLVGTYPIVRARTEWYGKFAYLYERVSDGRLFACVPRGMVQGAIEEFVEANTEDRHEAYTVEQYTIKRDAVDMLSGTKQWDDQSAHQVDVFDTAEEARSFYEECNIRKDWIGEKNSAGLVRSKSKVYAREIVRVGVDEDGELDYDNAEIVEYEEYGWVDYRAEQG